MQDHSASDQFLFLVALAGIAVFVAIRPPLAPSGFTDRTDSTGLAPQVQASDTHAARSNALLQGIDVSHYQGEVDWDSVASAGMSFTFIKATEGVRYVDPRFDVNQQGAKAAGLLAGAYHFFHPSVDPVAQAEHFLATAPVGRGWLPAVLDLEKSPDHGQANDIAEAARTWLEHVEQATGCRPLVYTNRSFWQTHLDSTLAEFPLWYAQYADQPRPPENAPDWSFWQHSQRGQVPGIDGAVDMNLFSGNADQLQALICGGAQ